MWLFICLSAAFLIVQEGAVTGYDGATMVAVTESLVERGSVAVSPEFNTMPGRGNLEYSRYGLGLSLLAVPPYLMARSISVPAGAEDKVLEGAVSLTMAFVTAALCVALYLLARRLQARVGPALLMAVGGVVGTLALPYSKEFFSEPLAVLCLVVAIERVLAGRPSASGLAMGAAVATRTQNVLLVPVLVGVAWRRGGVPAVVRACASMVPGALVVVGYNLARFGDPLTFGYEDVGFTTPLLTGVSGLLFNPLKSVLLFAPLVVLVPFALWRLWRRDRAATVLLAANLGITFVVTAAWFAWHGGWSWGPRLVLPGLLPAFTAIAPWLATTARVHTAAVLVAAGFVVSFPALVVPTQAQQLETPPVPPDTHFLDTQPLASPSALRQWELVVPTAQYSFEHRYEGRDDGRNYLRYLSVWQLGASRFFGPLGLGAAVVATAVLAAVTGWAGRELVHAARMVGKQGTEPTAEGVGLVTPPDDRRARDAADGRPVTVDGAAAPYVGAGNLEAMDEAENYNALLTSFVHAHADRTRPVLDFGAGHGTHARRLRDLGLDVRCVEPDTTLRTRLRDDGFEAAATVDAWEPALFGTVYSLNVLEHIEDDRSAVQALRAALTPGGRLVLYVPAFQILFSEMDRTVGHYRRYRRAQLIALVQGSGLDVVDACYVDSLGFAAALVYRLVGRSGDLDPRAVALYDRTVLPVSRLIDRLTARRVGKNLLVVGRRD